MHNGTHCLYYNQDVDIIFTLISKNDNLFYLLWAFSWLKEWNSANTEIDSLKFKECCFQVLQIFLPFWIKSIDYNLSFLDDALCRTFSTTQ